MSTKPELIKLRVTTTEKEALSAHGNLSAYIRSCVPELRAPGKATNGVPETSSPEDVVEAHKQSSATSGLPTMAEARAMRLQRSLDGR